MIVSGFRRSSNIFERPATQIDNNLTDFQLKYKESILAEIVTVNFTEYLRVSEATQQQIKGHTIRYNIANTVSNSTLRVATRMFHHVLKCIGGTDSSKWDTIQKLSSNYTFESEEANVVQNPLKPSESRCLYTKSQGCHILDWNVI